MGLAHPLTPRHRRIDGDPPPLRHDLGKADIRALLEENMQLRELVIQLTKLAVKNIVDSTNPVTQRSRE